MKKSYLFMLAMLIVLYSCTSSPDLDAEELPSTPRPGQTATGSLTVNCVITPQVLRDVCDIDENILLDDKRNDIRDDVTCYIKRKTNQDIDYRLSVSDLAEYNAQRFPIEEVVNYNRNTIQNLEELKIARTVFNESLILDNKEINIPGGKAFVVSVPTATTRATEEFFYGDSEEELRNDVSDIEPRYTFYTLEESPLLAFYAEKDGVLYQLRVATKGNFLEGRYSTIGERSDVIGGTELCSIEEGIELIRRMVSSMISDQQVTQDYSGCAITPELVMTKCDLQPPEGVELVAKYLRGECTITAQTRTSASFLIAAFDEVDPGAVQALIDTVQAFPSDTYEEVAGVGDSAVMGRSAGGDEDFSLHFKVGNRAGKLTSGGEIVEIYDPAIQNVIRIEGCNANELKDIATTTLVPYLGGE